MTTPITQAQAILDGSAREGDHKAVAEAYLTIVTGAVEQRVAAELEGDEAPSDLTDRELGALKLLAEAWNVRDRMLATLTATQARCTALLEENRTLKAGLVGPRWEATQEAPNSPPGASDTQSPRIRVEEPKASQDGSKREPEACGNVGATREAPSTSGVAVAVDQLWEWSSQELRRVRCVEPGRAHLDLMGVIALDANGRPLDPRWRMVEEPEVAK